MTQRTLTVDLCVIGAGAAGLSVAAGAAQLGRKVALVEKGEMGGDCLNYGCIPSKALIAAAARVASAGSAGALGVKANASADFAGVMDHVRGVIAEIAPIDSQERFESLGVTVIREKAAFISPGAVRAGDAEIRARRFVIATGSSPRIPDIEGLADVPYFTNETIFTLRSLPEHLLIIGGGPIGSELAQAFARLGAGVSLFEKGRILPREDGEAVDIVRAAMKRDGVAVHEGADITRIARAGGRIRIERAGAAAVEGSHLLVAVGRTPSLDGLGLEAAGVARSERGIEVDERLRTANRRIYAIGDVAGGAQFTHVAGDHAATVIRNILFKMPAKRRDALAPRVTYTSPEIAAIGAAPEAGHGARLARWPLRDNDRAQTERSTEGFIKVVTDRKGCILGATIVGEGAGDLLLPWSLALANRLKISAFTNAIAPYPTRGEISKRAAGAWYTPSLFSARTRFLVRLLALFD